MRRLKKKHSSWRLVRDINPEFLANMSHELRTPLNSLLILAQILSENRERNLTAKQVEYIKTIYSSGNDLLNLINDVLDLAKVESGKLDVISKEVELNQLRDFIYRQFSPSQIRRTYILQSKWKANCQRNSLRMNNDYCKS